MSYTGSICWILLCVLPNALAVPIVSSVTTTPTTLDRSTLLDWLGAQLSRTAETTPGLARRMQTVAGADDLTMRHLRDRGKSLLDVLLATPGAEADAVARAAKLEVCHEVPLMRGGPNFFWLKRETTTDSAASLEPLKTLLQTLQTSVAKGVERLLTAEIAPYPKGPYKQFTYTNRYSPAVSAFGI